MKLYFLVELNRIRGHGGALSALEGRAPRWVWVNLDRRALLSPLLPARKGQG